MMRANANDWVELRECLRALELTLERLDDVGAGIAAIHVDAAIQQLHTNLQTIEDANLIEKDAQWVRIYPGHLIPH